MSDIPFIPENAPFTPEQRAWVNGYLAGMLAAGKISGAAAPAPGEPVATKPMLILYGTQTGTAEGLSHKIARSVRDRGFAGRVLSMSDYAKADLVREENLLIVTSTYGDGDMPDNAQVFWDYLRTDSVPRLPHLGYSVLALGDKNYPRFCEAGKNFDRRLEELGARRVSPRVDCDVDYENSAEEWLKQVLGVLGDPAVPAPASAVAAPAPEVLLFGKKNPFPGRLLTNRKMSGEGSGKDVRHFEISLEGSGLSYEVGDALGVFARNCPQLVDEMLGLLGFDGEEAVRTPEGGDKSLRKAMIEDFEITKPSRDFLVDVAHRSQDPLLKRLLEEGQAAELKKHLWGRGMVNWLCAFPRLGYSAPEFAALLKKNQPRLYSISSSLKAHPAQVHLTVAAVRYEAHGRSQKGVCSTFLADRAGAETPVPVFVHASPSFKLPADPDRPVIMVGPGTGIAPFRAFLEERKVTGARGKNWLFFGDQHEKSDFYYREELEDMMRQGVLTRLSTAFSRDQPEKIYVQQRLLENASALWAWLEEGAHFYVCGDASRMARDVDAALHDICERAGGLTTENAAAYVKNLKAAKRYSRDVY